MILNEGVKYSRYIFKRAAFLSIVFSPFAAYSLNLGISISIDRFFLLISLGSLFACMLFQNKTQKITLFYVFIIFYLLFVSYLNSSFEFSGLLSYVLALSYFIVTYYYFYEVKSWEKIQTLLSIWTFIFLLFAGWALYNQLILKNLVYSDPLGIEYSDPVHRKTMMLNGRLFLPYASAPFLAFVCGFIFIWNKIRENIYHVNRWESNFISISSIVILFLTQSRGPLYSLVVCLSFYYAMKFIIRREIKFSFLILIVFSLAVCGYVVYSFHEVIFSSRLIPSLESILQSRHADLRLEALEIYSNFSTFNLFLGHGTGYYSLVGNAPYSFMSYLTVLIELGLIGLFLFLIITFLPTLFICFKILRNNNVISINDSGIIALNFYIAFCHIFYEYKTLVPLWILLGLLASISSKGKIIKNVY
ncbi:hypothetical protein RT723_16550 [Psychrosphaera aquimarina]|uniref:O-antigen ligase-related domain-containing protein n=1 Tax=Psychrosphaera aquimarina TaxID=2044854 RepID=A0ABU3R4G9_9GAMM|nr:O-antigen ligase family protein [Psychrosphaera aquimarina]MDU0114570.1 hypothetical protein [Psychrosphaera aquimarina]